MMIVRKHLTLLLSAALLATAIGCGPPRIRIEWSQPAAFSLPTNVPVAVVVETDGPQPAASTVMDAALDISRGQVMNKWLAVPSVRSEFVAALKQQGYQVVDVGQAQALIKVKPLAWSYELTQAKKLNLTSGRGRLDVRLEVYDARKPNDGALYTEEYWATGSADHAGEPEALSRAARVMPTAFFRDLQPRRVSSRVELDDSDPLSETGIELCRKNQFNAAYEFFHDTVERAPDNAPALYNYAVMAEIKGQYDQAEALLMRATKLNQKPMYYSALQRVRGARNDAQAMSSP